MKTFSFYNPVKIYFGKNTITNLRQEIEKCGENILITYGRGSIKKNGIYDTVLQILKDANKTVFELGGIMPNPRTEKVYEGISICKKYNIDFVLAVGGGSVIDCTKAIVAGAKMNDDFWQTLFIERQSLTDALPFGTVLTMAATGSEMNSGGVITNWAENLKIGYNNPLLYPKFSILDPVYTYTLPKDQMVFGCVDILSHLFELYFSTPDESNVSDSIAEALMKSVIENLNAALVDPKDYNARGNLLWASSLALNGVARVGKTEDWMGHQIEHALSAFYDIPHGAGLAIVHPAYLKYIYKNKLEKFARFAENIWQIDTDGRTLEDKARIGIEKIITYFKGIGAPTTLKEVGIPVDAIDKIIEKVNIFPTSYASLTREDVKQILLDCAE